ncbi:MAG: bifunctional phosphopantothenoylcysteine decarboxylase/phosphopantothenate--cysteine ligase CoaBC [bacterium]
MKNILVGICGSIAGYKSPLIIRELQKKDYPVKVMMTEAAQNFISPRVLQYLLRDEIYSESFNSYQNFKIPHIDAAQWADLILISPASANTIAKLSLGISDNLLTSTVLAFQGPVLIAPAMNSKMWENPKTQEHVENLKKGGRVIIYPETGELACGTTGSGRLAELSKIILEVEKALTPPLLKNLKVVVSAGGSCENIDQVRVITNLSSGKMGVAFARNAYLHHSKEVSLVHSPSVLPPGGIKSIPSLSSDEFRKNLEVEAEHSDLLIMSAAISDFKPLNPVSGKIPRKDNLSLNLVSNPDIVAGLKKKFPHLFILGFALETENYIDKARQKIKQKNLDMILVNSLQSLNNECADAWLLNNQGEILCEFKNTAKNIIAQRTLKIIADQLST